MEYDDDAHDGGGYDGIAADDGDEAGGECEHDRMAVTSEYAERSAPLPRAATFDGGHDAAAAATPRFACKLKRTELMIQMLQALQFGDKHQQAFLTFQELGIKVTVEKNKTLQVCNITFCCRAALLFFSSSADTDAPFTCGVRVPHRRAPI